jgi:hypothetical protein
MVKPACTRQQHFTVIQSISGSLSPLIVNAKYLTGSYERKKERALAIMESKKCDAATMPPLLRGLWKLGLRIPPLPFASFWQIIFPTGFSFGLAWGSLCGFSHGKVYAFRLPQRY